MQYENLLGKGQAKYNTDNDSCVSARSLMKVEGVGHDLYMDYCFSFPDLFDDLHTRYQLL
jgi:hypothetical protein